jgi:hypothetical protein
MWDVSVIFQKLPKAMNIGRKFAQSGHPAPDHNFNFKLSNYKLFTHPTIIQVVLITKVHSIFKN